MLIDQDWEWIEPWIDITSLYILFIVKYNNKDSLFVVDVRLGSVEEKFSTYEDAKNYLLEDEYTLIKGRLLSN